MYGDEWNRFMQTGQISDYLTYRGYGRNCHDFGHIYSGHIEYTARKSEEIQECTNAGFCSSYGDYNKVRTNRRV